MIDLNNLKDKKVEIKYPTIWHYKVIINSHCKIKHILKNVLGDREYHLEESLSSKNKNYQSYKVGILVHNDDDRKTLYEELKKEDCVKIVL